MTTDPPVLLERRGHTALIRLNRPQRHNPLVPELLHALLAALRVRAGLDAEREAFVAQIQSAGALAGTDRFLENHRHEE